MKRILCAFLVALIFSMQTGVALAIQEAPSAAIAKKKAITYNKNARTISYAFVFDGPSDKNKDLLAEFQKSITATTAPDFKATFPKEYVFVGDWTKAGVKKVMDKALASKATMVISLGYLSTKYYNSLSNKNKLAVTIDQYGLKDLGNDFYNPERQSVKGVQVFKRLVDYQNAAVLMTDSFYQTRNNWNEFASEKVPGVNFTFIPVKNDVQDVVNKIPVECDAVIFTPIFNMSTANKKELINVLNERQIPTYSTLGREDVEAGVLMGTGAMDVDQKLANATSFSIKGVLNGERKFDSKISFYDEQVLYLNKDTASLIGHKPHLRVLATAEIISNEAPEVYSLGTIFTKFEENNLDVKRAIKTVQAARRSSVAAMLKWLPSFGITLGYQEYNHDYAESAKLLYPEETGIFKMGFEQVIFAPELVTNILLKHKQVNFKKSEQKLIEQSMGLQVATLYVEALMLENMVKIQKEYVKESRENLAIAKVREKIGKCGAEEPLRWASQLRINEEKLIEMDIALKNVKIAINKILSQNPTTEFALAELKATDPAFYTSEINLINYVTNPEAIEKFTQMLVEEVYRVSPELAKLKAAQKMKQYEMAMYYQKFVLPSAKLTFDYTSMIDPKYAGNTLDFGLPLPIKIPRANKTNGQFGIFAQWKPIEGGTKIAEIARTKAELDELKLYEQEAREELEAHVREVINRAIASYIVIEKKYKAMYASAQNYQLVKRAYLEKDNISIAQLADAQKLYLDSKVAAMNSQYSFFKELLWVQRGLCSVNWLKADKDSKAFIQKIKDTLEEKSDIQLL